MAPLLSVVICTHNPRREYLARVLAALRVQSLGPDTWELLLIDNASNTPLAGQIDLGWHPHSRHIREDQLGVIHARLRGMLEAASDLIIFVDDDNVLDSEYLKVANRIAGEFPAIGFWNGRCLPEFEAEPPAWTREYWHLLAIREDFPRDMWWCLPPEFMDTLPCSPWTAGCCLRRRVAQRYLELAAACPDRLRLGRKGAALTSAEDYDIALTTLEMNLGLGMFRELVLTHLIPARRLEETYLLALVEGITYSSTMLRCIRGEAVKEMSPSRSLLRFARSLFMRPRAGRFYRARGTGRRLAIQDMRATHGSGSVV